MKRNFLLASLLIVAVSMMAQQPVITFEKTEHDFGKINENDGRVSTIFEFKNEGMEPLVLSNVRASCGCTTPTWTRTPIEPGAKGTITVTYNPKGRPGRFQKTVTVTSNAQNATAKLYIKGEVIPAAAKPVNKYPVTMGDVSFNKKSIQFGTVMKGANTTRSLEYANLTDHEITVAVLTNGTDIPFLTSMLSLETVQPKQSGTLSINFDAAACKEWGPVTRRIYIMVNGKRSLTEEYQIDLFATVEEDFSQLTTAERQQAPILEIAKEIDLGTIKAGSKTSKKIHLKNAGVNTLHIRRIVNNNSNLKLEPAKSSIKGGKSTDLKLELNAVQSNGSLLGAGNYRRQIEIITNDPQQPKMFIYVKWTIE